MAPSVPIHRNVAPYVRQNKSKLRTFLSYLSCLTVIIWPLFNYICRLFQWDEEYVCDTKQNYVESSSILNVGDEIYTEENSSLPISDANHASLEGFKNQFQQLGKDVHDKLIESISQKLVQYLGEEVKQLILEEVGTSCCLGRRECKKSPTEDYRFDSKKEKKFKEPVENCSEKDEFKPKENKLEDKGDSKQGPGLLKCSGGNGNDTTNQPAGKQCEQQSNPITANPNKPSEGYGNNSGGFGGDGNDPHKRNREPVKGHYLDVPLEEKGKMPELERCFELQPETVAAPFPESSALRSDSTVNENRLAAENENLPSEEDRPLSFENMTQFDEKDENSQSSNNGNGKDVVNGFGQGAMSTSIECVMPVNTADMHSDSEQHGDVDSDDDLAQNDSETDNISTFHRMETSNNTQNLKSRRYKILYEFKSELSVGVQDGLYLPPRDFIILGKIGSGQFGVCFEILDIKSAKKFALKKIPCEHFEQDEIAIWSVLSSNRNVVTLLGAYDDGKHVNIFMELMEGTLKYIADHHEALKIDDRKAAALMKPILKCLALTHEEGFIHGDIKPENVLYGNNDVKVGDFGLAVDRRKLNSKMIFRGTVPYMAKELFCGGKIGASADIYAAGCVWKCLLNGSPPWKGCPRETIIFKVGSGEIPEMPNDCSEETKELLRKMFEPDNAKRPTADELLQDPTFLDTSEFTLDEVLVEILVDTQLLRNNLPPAPMTLDANDYEPKLASPL